MTEAQLHRAVAVFLRQALKPPTTWTTMPAGGGGRIRGAQLKAMGLQPGWPDILIMHPRLSNGIYCGCYLVGLELKAKNGRLSPEQVERHEEIEKAGGVCFTARSIDEVSLFLRGYGIPLHATTGRAA